MSEKKAPQVAHPSRTGSGRQSAPLSENEALTVRGAVLPKQLASGPRILLVDHHEFSAASFWVTCFSAGTGSFDGLLGTNRVHEVLQKLSMGGFSLSSPAMLVSAQPENEFRILAIPTAMVCAEGIDEVVDTVNNWSAPKIGFYFSDHDLGPEQMETFLVGTICRLLALSTEQDFLVARSRSGLNHDLHLLSAMKTRLQNQGIEVTIYH